MNWVKRSEKRHSLILKVPKLPKSGKNQVFLGGEKPDNENNQTKLHIHND